MKHLLLCLLALFLVSPAAAAQGKLVTIPEDHPSPALRKAVRAALALESEPLHLHLGKLAPEGAVLLDIESEEWLWDGELERRMLAAEAIQLSGGTLLEWYDALLARRERVRFVAALYDALRAGTHLVGVGGAAAFLSRGTSIPREELIVRPDSRPRNPRASGEFSAVTGMGLGPPGYIDSAAFERGTRTRWLRALETTKIDVGWWFAPDSALLYDFQAGRVTVLGPGQVELLELRGVRRKRTGTFGARLSVLAAGDSWDRKQRRLQLPGGTRSPGRRADGEPASEFTVAAALARTEHLFPGRGPADQPQPRAWAVLTSDQNTLWTGPDDAPRPVRVHLDWHHPLTIERIVPESRKEVAAPAEDSR